MTVNLEGVSEVNSAAAGSTVVIPVPAGTVDGHLLIGVVEYNNATAMVTPSGWNIWHTATTTALGVAAYWRPASSEPASYTWTLPASARNSGMMTTWSGADTITPEDVASVNTVGTTAITFSPLTPISPGAVLLAIGAAITGAGETSKTWTPSNMTLDVDACSPVAAQTNAAGAIMHQPWTSGAFTPAVSQSGTSTRTLGITSVIRPAGSGTGTGAQNSALVAEALGQGTPAAQASGTLIEVVADTNAPARIAESLIETFGVPSAVGAVTSGLFAEVLGSPTGVQAVASGVLIEVMAKPPILGIENVARTGVVRVKHSDDQWYPLLPHG